MEAFGEYDESKVFTVPRSEIPEDLKPEVGDEMVLTGEDDDEIGVTVTAVSEEGITFDANHPLAGAAVTFEVQVIGVL